MKRRVVVTGLGAVTPIGNDVESFWNGVKEGKVGIRLITRFDTTGYKATLAAELKDFVAKDRMDPRTARRMEPFSQYAVAAALEAVENSGLKMEEEDPYMVGVIIGSGVGSLQATETNEKKLMEKGPFKSGSASCSEDDHKYGSRKCFYRYRRKRKMHQRGNGMCDRNTLYRRCFPCHSVW